MAVTLFGVGVFVGAVAALFAVSERGVISTRGRWVLLAIVAVVMTATVSGILRQSDGLGAQITYWAADAGVIVSIASIVVLDWWNRRREVVSDRILARTGWIMLGSAVLLEVAWQMWLYSTFS